MAGHRRWITVDDQSAVGEVRRLARIVGAELGLAPDACDRAGLAATELATNLLRHAGGGRMLVTEMAGPAPPTLAVVAADRGPGIANIDHALVDGVSSTQTRGIGLGAVRRMADAFDITSGPGGTTIVCVFHTASVPDPRVHVASMALNYPGEAVCGDGWAIRRHARTTDILLCDGLGHGPHAHAAAAAACAAVGEGPADAPAAQLTRIGLALEGTRGAVGFLASISNDHDRIDFAGVGNIAALVVSREGVRRLGSRPGVLGDGARIEPRGEAAVLRADETLILHTDGLVSSRTVPTLPASLAHHSPALVVASLLSRLWQARDDGCALVARRRRA